MIISKKISYKLLAVITALQFTSTVFAADAKATASATIIGPANAEADVTAELAAELAANSWAQLLYSGSPGVLTFTIPGSGSLTVSRSKPCTCRLTGSPAQIASQISCSGSSNSGTCASSVNVEQMAKLMTCSGTESNQDFCACEIVGSVEQIAALLFCNGTLRGSKAISLMVTESQDGQTEKSAVIIVAYN